MRGADEERCSFCFICSVRTLGTCGAGCFVKWDYIYTRLLIFKSDYMTFAIRRRVQAVRRDDERRRGPTRADHYWDTRRRLNTETRKKRIVFAFDLKRSFTEHNGYRCPVLMWDISIYVLTIWMFMFWFFFYYAF